MLPARCRASKRPSSRAQTVAILPLELLQPVFSIMGAAVNGNAGDLSMTRSAHAAGPAASAAGSRPVGSS